MAQSKKIARKPEKKLSAQLRKDAGLVPGGVPVTGLGETIEQITALAKEKAKVLFEMTRSAKARNTTSDEDLLEAAYQYGLCERRRRHLARKVNGSGREED